MREPPVIGVVPYRGFFHCLMTVAKQEGVRALYAGMPTHLLRAVPNAVIVFMTYEWVVQSYRDSVKAN
jgi:solute carrier family 25 protein 33/36